jgi:predicted RNA-binding protein with PUA-like domain
MAKSRTNNKSKKIIEQGDIFFFYRPKVGAEEVEGIKDVQRFYMVTSPDDSNKYRLFLVGQKQSKNGTIE